MPELAEILKHNLVGKMINHGCVFFINVLIVRLLGSNISGYFFNELYLFNFIAFIASLGLDYAAIRYYGEDHRLLRSINRKLLLVATVSSGIFLLLFSITSLLAIHWFSMPLAGILFCIGNLLMILYQGVLSARKQFNLQNMVLGLSNLAYLILLGILFISDRFPGIKWIAISYSLLFLLQGICLMYYSFREEGPSESGLSLKPMVRHGIWIMFSSLIYFAFLRIDNFFVEKYTTDNSLGSYVQCGKIGQYFLYFSSIISSTLLPFIHEEKIAVTYTSWRNLMKPYILILLLTSVFIAAAGPWLFPFLFGPGFENMHRLMWIFLPGFFGLGLLTLMNAVYIGNNRVKRIFFGDTLGLTLVLVFDILLVPKYGAIAAALISSMSYIIVFLYLLAGFKQNFEAPLR
ncbi:MAG: oligosaccharide flippase family protein [Bacteroidetes bacterium]|nr:oligosaccharide flippase family protein [Bacteroidota bacterium]